MAVSNYNNTDQRLHWLSQTIAKANRTYVAKKEDGSHTNLYYDDLDNRLIGRWINNGSEDFMLTLNLATLQFDWLDSKKQEVHSVAALCQVISDVESELADILTTLGLEPTGFNEPLHFQIPEYSFASEPVESIEQTDIDPNGRPIENWPMSFAP